MYFLRFWLMVGLVSKVIIWFIDRICCSYNAVELPMGKGLWVCRTFACAGVYKLQCWCILLVLGCVWAGCSVDAADCKCSYRLERCILDAFCLKISQANCLLREAFTGRLKPYLCCSCSFLPPCCSFLQMPFAQTSGLLDPPRTAISHGFPGHIFLQITSGQAHFFVFVSCAVVLRGRQWGMLKWAQLALAGLHRMMEWFKLEGALKVFWVQPCCHGQSHLLLEQAAVDWPHLLHSSSAASESWVQGKEFLLTFGASPASSDVGLKFLELWSPYRGLEHPLLIFFSRCFWVQPSAQHMVRGTFQKIWERRLGGWIEFVYLQVLTSIQC